MKDLDNLVFMAKSYDALANVSSMAYGRRDLGLTDTEYKILEEICDKALSNINKAFMEGK